MKEKLKILYMSRLFPFPPNRGERQRDWYLLKNLAKKHDVTLLTRVYEESDFKYLSKVESVCDKVITVYIPTSKNLYQSIARVFKPLFTGVPLSTGTMCFSQIGMLLKEELGEGKYDVVQFEHTTLAYYLKFIPKTFSGIKVIDLHNLETNRYKVLQQLSNTSFLKKLFFSIDRRRMEKFERKSLKHFDHIFTVSDQERDVVRSWHPQKKVTTLNNGIDLSVVKDDEIVDIASNNNEILFVGSMNYHANDDAMQWFIHEIFPIIKASVPKAHLTIVGHGPSISLKKLASETVTITGFVESVKPYYNNASVFIVPLRAGGGSRLKILEALNYGVPVVSTHLGAEGLDLQTDIDIKLTTSCQIFAEHVIALVGSSQLRIKIAKRARKKIRQLYNWENISDRHDSTLTQTVQGLKSIKKNN